MEKKQVTTKEKVIISGVTIVTEVQTSIFSWKNKERASFFCLKKPLNLTITDREGKTTSFSLQGTPDKESLFLH
jgi:hypothetical protein